MKIRARLKYTARNEMNVDGYLLLRLMSYRECQRIDNKTKRNMRTVYVINTVSGLD